MYAAVVAGNAGGQQRQPQQPQQPQQAGGGGGGQPQQQQQPLASLQPAGSGGAQQQQQQQQQQQPQQQQQQYQQYNQQQQAYAQQQQQQQAAAAAYQQQQQAAAAAAAAQAYAQAQAQALQARQPATHYCIDVECVATGTDHNSRAVGQIALVDQWEQVILDIVVRPEQPVSSYLTALTGLTADVVARRGVPLADAVAQLRACLPASAVLVGQNILQDVQWLGLKEGADFAACVDLAGLYRIWNARYNSWSIYSQDHLAKVLLGMDPAGQHNAVLDAVKSVRLYNLHQQLQQGDPSGWERAQRALVDAPPTLSFARQNPTYEGVCMGNRKTCRCGAPFFS